MKKSTKIFKLITSIALVLAIGVGFTLAYLSSVTDTKENKFTSSSNITGEITEEEEWNEGWTDYKPGESKAKTPTISLTSGSESAYVGMKVEFYNTTNGTKVAITADEFATKFGTLSYNNATGLNLGTTGNTWKNVAVQGNSTFYMYNPILTAGQSSAALFDKVTINTGIYTYYDISQTSGKVYKTDENGNKTELLKEYELIDENTKLVLVTADGKEVEVTGNTNLPSFQIDVTGFATQAYVNGNDVTVAKATTELLKLSGLIAK